MLSLLTALALAGTADTGQPRVFEKVRSDGVTVVCVRHDERPTIFTSRTECREPSEWRRATAYEYSAGAGDRPNFATVLREPQRVPTLVGK